MAVPPIQVPGKPTGLTYLGRAGIAHTIDWVQPADWGSQDTDDYLLQYSLHSDFSQASEIPVFNISLYDLEWLSDLTKYYVRVQAVNSAGPSLWSSTINFTSGNGIIIGTLAVPTLKVALTHSAVVQWTIPSSAGDQLAYFQVQASKTPAFDRPLNFTSNLPRMEITGLDAGTEYYVRVRSVREDQASSIWGPSLAFFTAGKAKAKVGGVWVPAESFIMVEDEWEPYVPQKRISSGWFY